MNTPARHKGNYFLAIGLSVLISMIIPLAQYYFRRFDDNNFISWDWVFRIASPATFFAILLPALLLVVVAISSLSIPLPPRMRSLFLFFACLVSVSVLWTAPEVNVDTSRYFMQAKHLELYGMEYFLREWGNAIPAWTDLPAMPFFYGIVFRLFSESRIFIQFFVGILFALTAVFTSLIGEMLWDEDTGFYAGAFLLGMPYLLVQTPLMLVDVPTMFFLTLSIYLFLRALTADGIARASAAVCAIFLTAWCKYSTVPMLSVLVIIAIIFFITGSRTSRPQILRRSLWIFLAVLVLTSIAVGLKYNVVLEQFKLLMNFQRTGLDRWGESYLSTLLFQVHPIITIAAIASLIVAALKRDFKYLIAVWLPLLIVVFQIKRIRYTIPVFPMLALMAAYGLSVVREKEYRKLLVACVVVTSLATAYFAYLPFLKHWSTVNLQQAGALLDTLDIDTVEVFTTPQQNYPINPAVAVPILDLMTHKPIVYHYLPGTSTPDEDVLVSRFRFSWEYRNPAYYFGGTDAGKKRAVVLISGRARDKVPPAFADTIGGLHRSMSFTTINPIFFYQTLVRIYW